MAYLRNGYDQLMGGPSMGLRGLGALSGGGACDPCGTSSGGCNTTLKVCKPGWCREHSESVDGSYEAAVGAYGAPGGSISDGEAMRLIYAAIAEVDPVYPIANKPEFAGVLFEQLYGESGGKDGRINTCCFSGSGPAGISQFSRGTWSETVWKLMNWTAPPLTSRCNPWLGILAQVIYMAYKLDRNDGNMRKALQSYNGDASRKVAYANNILTDYKNGKHDYAGLLQQSDPTGAVANANRVEFP